MPYSSNISSVVIPQLLLLIVSFVDAAPVPAALFTSQFQPSRAFATPLCRRSQPTGEKVAIHLGKAELDPSGEPTFYYPASDTPTIEAYIESKPMASGKMKHVHKVRGMLYVSWPWRD